MLANVYSLLEMSIISFQPRDLALLVTNYIPLRNYLISFDLCKIKNLDKISKILFTSKVLNFMILSN